MCQLSNANQKGSKNVKISTGKYFGTIFREIDYSIQKIEISMI